jgi:hypothetical protein
MVANHIATIDQISSTFFDQKVDYRGVEPANCSG